MAELTKGFIFLYIRLCDKIDDIILFYNAISVCFNYVLIIKTSQEVAKNACDIGKFVLKFNVGFIIIVGEV